jgi:hypothetical protein
MVSFDRRTHTGRLQHKKRCDLLETGYWVLELYEELLTKIGLPLGVTQKIFPGGFASPYSEDQFRDGLNTFMSLISIIRESPTAVFLSHLGSDPLEHVFCQARVRCRDVNTMEKMLKAFSFNLEKISCPFLDYSVLPRANILWALFANHGRNPRF